MKSVGYLGVHINLEKPGPESAAKMSVGIRGYDTADPEETQYLRWEGKSLAQGDLLAVEVSPDVQSDPPSEIKSSLKNAKCFSVDDAQAERILKAAYQCNESLTRMISSLKAELPEAEYKKIAHGVARVINEVFESVAEPLYRKFPSKRPSALNDLPL